MILSLHRPLVVNQGPRETGLRIRIKIPLPMAAAFYFLVSIATLCMYEMKPPGRMASDAIVRAERGSNEPR